MDNPTIISVGTTPIKISGASNRLKARPIRNLGAGSIFLGGNETVESDNTNDLMGWEVVSGADFPDSLSHDEIWAVSASGTNDVQIWEVK